MTVNISSIKRNTLINNLEQIKEYVVKTGSDKELLEKIDEIHKELLLNKYGLVFEEHEENIDRILKDNLPVYTQEKDLIIDGDRFNFLIEGDNLAALQLLKKTHKNLIDYIYIDPPYNTKNKDFMYDDSFIDPNDSFKHSKWLSFMEKRLLEAYSLLKDTGCIMISINEEEVFELKMLCDKIFGYDNYMAMFSVKVRHQDRILKGDKDFHEIMEYMLMYRKTSNFRTIKRLVDNTSNKDYVYQIIENVESTESINMDGKEVKVFKPNEYEIRKLPASAENLKKINIRGSIKEGNSSGRFFMKHLEKFIGKNLGYLYKVPNMGDDKFGYRYFLIPDNPKRANGDYFQGVPLNRKSIKEVPYPNYIEIENEYLYEERLNYLDFETDFNNVGYEGYVEFRNGKKPLNFLDKCFELAGVKKNKNAIVLDFFAGSGSTGHALMKLNNEDNGNRKFILVTNSENNICRDVTYKRLSSVINEDNYDEGLKFYKIDFIDIKDKEYYDYSDKLMNHISELIEIENNIDIAKSDDFRIILNDDELEKFIDNNCIAKKIYIGSDVLIDNKANNYLIQKGIQLIRVPEHYYKSIV
ncbi:DNA methyltransferase [Clostridium perfringens]|uniref:DNA methyltransferase n=1 Tax=Clostridium perfringens TaxID=1502 RepID=UPI001CD0300B|nr:site-specific DNA-methyltransferase [Clostridium perfringens]MDK0616690.1 site-specific DNA-methyltransferase [Clostridium perfringens]UBK75976.1 site-specific DNA-methyltransferase [Clostridium perfringens]